MAIFVVADHLKRETIHRIDRSNQSSNQYVKRRLMDHLLSLWSVTSFRDWLSYSGPNVFFFSAVERFVRSCVAAVELGGKGTQRSCYTSNTASELKAFSCRAKGHRRIPFLTKTTAEWQKWCRSVVFSSTWTTTIHTLHAICLLAYRYFRTLARSLEAMVTDMGSPSQYPHFCSLHTYVPVRWLEIL